MKSYIFKSILLFFVVLSSVDILAAGPPEHFSTASAHSAQAIGQITVAGVKLVSGVAAVPLIIVGEAGKVSAEAGDALWVEAISEIAGPLPITDEIITSIAPPDQAMEKEEE